MYQKLIDEIWKSAVGLENVILSGVDGIAITSKFERESEEILIVEAANLVKESKSFGDELKSGKLQHIVSHYDDLILVIRMITDDYFLLGLLKEPKYLGRVSYLFTLKSYEWYGSIA